ncbi:hypothetical protein M9458_003561, partial [Cirrhinus mrigala]
MLKIDSSGPSSSTPECTGGQDSANPNAQSKRRSSKKLAARINTPQTDVPAAAPLPPPLAGQPPLLPSMATELGRVCMGLGMGPPEFAFLRNRQ